CIVVPRILPALWRPISEIVEQMYCRKTPAAASSATGGERLLRSQLSTMGRKSGRKADEIHAHGAGIGADRFEDNEITRRSRVGQSQPMRRRPQSRRNTAHPS